MDTEYILKIFEEVPSDNESFTNESSDEEIEDILSTFDSGNVIEDFDSHNKPVSRPTPNIVDHTFNLNQLENGTSLGLGLSAHHSKDDYDSDEWSLRPGFIRPVSDAIGEIPDSDDSDLDDDTPLAVRLNRDGVVWCNTIRKVQNSKKQVAHV